MRMIPRPRRLRRLSLALLLVSTAPAALAQYPSGAVVQPLPSDSDPAELLARALRTLAVEPNNLDALMAAGTNALALGDPNAAVGFLGRAGQIAPGNGKVKAGLGSALVQLEKPQDALRLFGDASRLGVPDLDIARDRGLAYDLTGDPRRAQKDYALVLAAHPEDDVARRRLALSQGISGDKAAALATLDPLIRKRDVAGWRAQTFVLAMDGDTKGASDITHIMLPTQADMLQPFLDRLAKLSPADRAKAVHFGEMPQSGASYTATQLANIGTTPTYAAAAPGPASTLRPARGAPAPLPRSDLAPVKSTPSAPAPMLAQGAAAQTQVAPTDALAAAQDIYRQAPTARSVIATSPAPGSAAPASASAPLAAAALTPEAPKPSTAMPSAVTSVPIPASTSVQATAPANTAPQPTQMAQAATTPPIPSASNNGHYDLPHVAAERSGARPTLVAPKPVSPAPRPAAPVAEMKTASTPIVHGRTADDVAAADAVKPSAPKAKTEPVKLAAADTDDASNRAKTAKTTPRSSTKADASDDDTKAGRKGKGSKAEATDDDSASSKKGKTARGGTKLASADADDDGGTSSKSHKGGKGKESDDGASASSKSSKKAKAAEEKASEPKIYVQVAGGANRDDMDKAWAGVKKKAPDLMKGKTPSTTPLKATNRLLVGPFKDDAEAQAFVNKMAGKGLSGFTFKSGKGQKVDKVDLGE